VALLRIDPEADILYVELGPGPIEYSREVEPGLLLDFAPDGTVQGVEVWNVSRRVAQAAAESAEHAS
jgi:uncharacterized protein YuzE